MWLGKVIVIIILACGAMSFCGGCSTGQLQSAQEAAQIQQTTNESLVLIQGIWADSNMTDTQKTKATLAVTAQYAEKTGLILPEEKQNFMGVLELACSVYLAWQPLGFSKIDITTLSTLLSVAIWLFRKKK